MEERLSPDFFIRENIEEANLERKGNILEVINVSKRFGKVIALEGVSLGVKENTIFGLLGSNGAGKSTLLHIITGLLGYQKGEIYIFNKQVKSYSKSLKRRIAIVPQKISLYDDLSIKDNLFFFGKAYGIKTRLLLEKINELKAVLQLGDLKRKVKHLSGGYQRRVSLAVALIGDPEIIILDEALVGIDLETKMIIMNLLIELKKSRTIIITTHAIDEAEMLCDYICFLHKGKKVIDGKTEDIISEYSSGQVSTIHLHFKNSEFAEQIMLKLRENRINVEIEQNILTVVGDMKKVLGLLNIVSKNLESVGLLESIEIRKPGLEQVIFNIIRSY